jgi:putative MATE family efflux protein
MDAPSETPPSRTGVWQLAWPAVVANLMQSMVGLVDIKVVGTLGSSAVAAATAGHRLFFVLQAVMMAISAGTTALVARAWGSGDPEDAERTVSTSLVLGGSVAAVMGVLGFAAADRFAALFGLAGEPAGLAAIYIRWISGFNVVFALGFVLLAGLRAAGDTRTPLLIGAINNAVNVLLLYMLVYGGFGFPKLGIAGAAISGGTAFLAGTTVVAILWKRGKLRMPPPRAFSWDATRMRKLVGIGYPAALEQLVFQCGFIAFTYIIARHFGTTALAAYGIGVQILSLSFVVGFGFSIAASTLVGQSLGARDTARATASGWRAMVLAVGSMSFLALVIIVFARPIAELMIDDAEVVRLIVVFIYLLGVAQPLMAIDFALAGALRGAGDTRFPLMTTFAGLIGGRVVLAVVFTSLGFTVEWIYAALLADYIVKASLLVGRFRSGRWQNALPPHSTRPPPAESVAPAPAASDV